MFLIEIDMSYNLYLILNIYDSYVIHNTICDITTYTFKYFFTILKTNQIQNFFFLKELYY